MGIVSTTTKYGKYNSYRLDGNETLWNKKKFDVSSYSHIVAQAQTIRTVSYAISCQFIIRFYNSSGVQTGSDVTENFVVDTTWTRHVKSCPVPSTAQYAAWGIKNTNTTTSRRMFFACAQVEPGEQAGVFDPLDPHRLSLLTANGLYTGVITADQVVTGKLTSASYNAWFDLDVPEIVMKGAAATLEITPSNPLKVTNSQDEVIGGLKVSNNKLYFTSTGLIPSDDSNYILDVFEESKPWEPTSVGSFDYGTGAGLRCYDLSGDTPRLAGTITYMSKNSQLRPTEGMILSGGNANLSLSNNEIILGITPYDDNSWLNGPMLKLDRSSFFLKNPYILIDASDYGAVFGVDGGAPNKRYGLVLEPDSKNVWIMNNGNKVFGADATGPYFQNGSTITRLKGPYFEAGTHAIGADSTSPYFKYSGATYRLKGNYFESGSNQVGVNSTGAYYTYNGATTYFHTMSSGGGDSSAVPTTQEANTKVWYTIPERSVWRFTFHCNNDNYSLDMLAARTSTGDVVMTIFNKHADIVVEKGTSGQTIGLTFPYFARGAIHKY